MRALIIPHFGDAEVLTLTDLADPSPGPGEVTIDVAYAGVNYAEVLFRKGIVSDLPLPFIPGIEVSGTIRAVGENVTRLRVGQPVAALSIVGGGGYAEVVSVPAELVFPLDEANGPAVDLAVAAAFPSNVKSHTWLQSATDELVRPASCGRCRPEVFGLGCERRREGGCY